MVLTDRRVRVRLDMGLVVKSRGRVRVGMRAGTLRDSVMKRVVVMVRVMALSL